MFFVVLAILQPSNLKQALLFFILSALAEVNLFRISKPKLN